MRWYQTVRMICIIIRLKCGLMGILLRISEYYQQEDTVMNITVTSLFPGQWGLCLIGLVENGVYLYGYRAVNRGFYFSNVLLSSSHADKIEHVTSDRDPYKIIDNSTLKHSKWKTILSSEDMVVENPSRT